MNYLHNEKIKNCRSRQIPWKVKWLMSAEAVFLEKGIML